MAFAEGPRRSCNAQLAPLDNQFVGRVGGEAVTRHPATGRASQKLINRGASFSEVLGYGFASNPPPACSAQRLRRRLSEPAPPRTDRGLSSLADTASVEMKKPAAGFPARA